MGEEIYTNVFIFIRDGRLLIPYAYRLFKGGFNVILLDLKGYGHINDIEGHWAFSDLVENNFITTNMKI